MIITNCSRCTAKEITLDILASNTINIAYHWQLTDELFCVCRACKKASIFVVVSSSHQDMQFIAQRGGFKGCGILVNEYVALVGFVSVKDHAGLLPPDHLPEKIKSAFEEAAKCLAIGCINAAATMFRLCVEFATEPLIPIGEDAPNQAKVRNLGPRIDWLFENRLLPEALHELSTCITGDGNDAAHRGELTESDAEDLLDFTVALLERLYTEKERLRLAKERRDARAASRTTPV